MKPYKHSLISVHKFGGIPSDYQSIHDWFDTTKSSVADVRHRMILHNAFGIFLCEQVFGTMEQKQDGSWVRMPYIVNSSGEKVQVRDVAEQHVIDDLGHIPGLEKCLAGMPVDNWMVGPIKKKKVIRMSDISFDKANIKIMDFPSNSDESDLHLAD